MAALPSVEPSSTTTTSQSGYSVAARDRTVRSIPTASLYAGTTIVTDGGWPESFPRRRRLLRVWWVASARRSTARPATSTPIASRTAANTAVRANATRTLSSKT